MSLRLPLPPSERSEGSFGEGVHMWGVRHTGYTLPSTL